MKVAKGSPERDIQRKKIKHKGTLATTLTFLVLGAFSLQFAFAGAHNLSHQNPILRDHFRRQYLEQLGLLSVTVGHTLSYQPRKDPFLERQVDRLIDDFLTRLREKLDALRARFDEVRAAQEEVLAFASNAHGRGRQPVRWKKFLTALADRAKDLRRMLAFILIDLKDKNDFKPEVNTEEENPEFRKELDFIEEQIAKAEQQINNFFYVPRHTVNVEDLEDGNMMIYLYRVQKMSKKLSEQL